MKKKQLEGLLTQLDKLFKEEEGLGISSLSEDFSRKVRGGTQDTNNSCTNSNCGIGGDKNSACTNNTCNFDNGMTNTGCTNNTCSGGTP